MDTLSQLGIPSYITKDIGIWVHQDTKKIAAIGVNVSQHVTTHGMQFYSIFSHLSLPSAILWYRYNYCPSYIYLFIYSGFALNVNPDLSFYKSIIPCGLDKEVTSISKELNRNVTIEEILPYFLRSFERVFERKLEVIWSSLEERIVVLLCTVYIYVYIYIYIRWCEFLQMSIIPLLCVEWIKRGEEQQSLLSIDYQHSLDNVTYLRICSKIWMNSFQYVQYIPVGTHSGEDLQWATDVSFVNAKALVVPVRVPFFFQFPILLCARLAQRYECLPPEQKVTGSIPVVG